jgi:protein deglycase
MYFIFYVFCKLLEEIESVTIINTLVRSGACVTVASVEDTLQITGSRGIKIVADKHINECRSHVWDLIACPGGMPGAERLRDCNVLKELLSSQLSLSKPIAAICASPAVIFATHGLLTGETATYYPVPAFRGM